MDNNAFHGTRFHLDNWHCDVSKTWVKNEFHTVGNTSMTDALKPFGLMCDFRIYARTLGRDELEEIWKDRQMESHPDQVVRQLASKKAAEILAQRLDVPDSAAECLRALGSLATLASQRARIFSVCGRQVLRMVDSPLPMIQRQAARLLNNLM